MRNILALVVMVLGACTVEVEQLPQPEQCGGHDQACCFNAERLCGDDERFPLVCEWQGRWECNPNVEDDETAVPPDEQN